MKIEWKDARRSTAIITKGWFKKRYAYVTRGDYGGWYFDGSIEPVSWWLKRCLNKAKFEANWTLVDAIPKASIHE